MHVDRIEPLLQGHIADVCRLHISVSSAPVTTVTLPNTLILKRPADPTLNPLGQAFDSFEREVHFYEAIAPKISLRVPQCWAIDHGDRGLPALLLEDLGVALSQMHHPTSFEQALERLAELHAVNTELLTIDHTIFSNINILKDICNLDSPSRSLYNSMHQSRFKAAVINALHTSESLPNDGSDCFLHCDFRWDNLLPAQGGTIIDWGDYCTGPRAYDLAYFLVTSLASLPDSQQPATLDQWLLTALSHYQTASRRMDQYKANAEELSTTELIASMTCWLPLAAWTPLTLLASEALPDSGKAYWRAVLHQSQRLFSALEHLDA